jgi:hypothetical protein
MRLALEFIIVAVGFWQAYRMGYSRGFAVGVTLEITKVLVGSPKKDDSNG